MRTTRFALVGVGNIGQGFLQIIAEKREFLRQRLGLQLLPVAAVDSTGAALNDAGLDVDELLRLKQTHAGVAASPRFGQPGLAPLDALQRAPANLRRWSARMCWSRPSSRACGVTYPMPLCRRGVGTTSSQILTCSASSRFQAAASSAVAGPTTWPSTSFTQRPGLNSR